jgi:hypothetical protein
MIPIGGIFGSLVDAAAAQDDLLSLGVAPEDMLLHPVSKPFWTNLAELDVPAEESILYEPYAEGNTSMLVVRTNILSASAVDDVLEQHHGLVVQMDVAPPEADVPMRRSEDR